jgi:hypothetical protein
MRFPYRKRLAIAAALAMWAACPISMSGCVFGGTGTDTENGVTGEGNVKISGVSARVVDGNGFPLKEVSLRLYLPGYRPDSGAAAPSLLASGAKAMTSDDSGYVTVQLAAAGKFVVEGVSAGQTVFFDTLAVPQTTSASLFTFRTRSVRAFKGKVKLASGMRVDSGVVFIRGTGRSAKVDAAGGYDLGVLPEDAGRMAVGLRFASSPIAVLQVTEATGGPVTTDTTKPFYTCKDLPKDSAAKVSSPFAATVSADSLKPSMMSKLDTAKVSSALHSCDTLAKGSVINVVSPSAGTKANAGVPLLVVQDAVAVSNITGTYRSDAVVVPYAECVPTAGHESTSFDLQLQASAAGSDILIKDVAEKCLVK